MYTEFTSRSKLEMCGLKQTVIDNLIIKIKKKKKKKKKKKNKKNSRCLVLLNK